MFYSADVCVAREDEVILSYDREEVPLERSSVGEELVEGMSQLLHLRVQHSRDGYPRFEICLSQLRGGSEELLEGVLFHGVAESSAS